VVCICIILSLGVAFFEVISENNGNNDHFSL
jgi:hypothetical protein